MSDEDEETVPILDLAPRAKAPPVISEPRCQVCQHSYRAFIEAQLVKGQSYSAIARHVPLDDGRSKDAFRRSIGYHYKHHMALEDAAMRAILEDEAKALGQNYEEGVRGAITDRGVLEIAIRKSYQDIQAGTAIVEPKDLIQMIKLKREMDSNTSMAQVEGYKSQMAIFITAIKDVCDIIGNGEEVRQMIAKRIQVLQERDGIETEIDSVMSQRHVGVIPQEVADAEVIEDIEEGIPPA